LGESAPANEPPLYLELFCPLPKPERAAWLVEKTTEVGVSAIRFVRSARAPRELTAGALARLGRVAAAAVEQCHRARVPALSGPLAWEEFSSFLAEFDDRYVLDPRAKERSPARSNAARVALVVGPEGGWSEAEFASLERAGCRPLRLGARVLRIETAAVVGAGLLLAGSD
jgi:16S rRNA (uracil1498-N3)-methyltransferase